MVATHVQKLGVGICLALVVFGWTPRASAAPPAPPAPPGEQANHRDDAQPQEAATGRERTSPVVRGRQPISKLRYIFGGAVGTYYGFGIGHAIVGEWSSSGWFYTVSEAMSLSVMLLGLYRSLQQEQRDRWRQQDDRPDPINRTNFAMVAGGAATYVVLRISEVHDLWTRPEVASLERRDDTAFAIGPAAADGGLGASFSLSW